MIIEIDVKVANSTAEAKKAIEIIANGLTKENLIAISKKIEKNAKGVNDKLPMGLKFV